MRFLPPAELRTIDDRALDALLEAGECVVAAGEGELRGQSAVALLRADYVALARNATLHLDSADAVRAAVARGATAVDGVVRANDALQAALCDELFDGDATAWFGQWLGTRDRAALDAAAVLIRSTGGDAKERDVFAKLFATGRPQQGLREFLSRNRTGRGREL